MNRPVYKASDFTGALARHRAALCEFAAIEAQIAKAAREAIMSRARAYLLYPEYLDLLRPGFEASAMTPAQLIWFSKELLWLEASSPAATSLKTISAKAAILAGRYRRALAHQRARMAACGHDEQERRGEGPAMARAEAALKEQAAKTARRVIKARARDYQGEPWTLNAIEEGLWPLPPRHLVTALAYLARTTPRRWVGFGGEVEAINLRGARLYARLARALAHQRARMAA